MGTNQPQPESDYSLKRHHLNKLSRIVASLVVVVLCLSFYSCQPAIYRYGKQFQESQSAEYLEKVVALIPLGADTSYLRKVLGEPIDMGFDYRYLTGLSGEKGCVIGAVFHLDALGKVDDKWIDEICE